MRSSEPIDELHSTRMSFGEHLDELRGRLFKAIVASVVGLVIAFIWHEELFLIITEPYRSVMRDLNQDDSLKATGIAQPFFAYIKVSFVVGLIGTAPFWIYQIWAFIAAGLYSHERRIVTKYVPFCVALFAAGILFGYHFLIPIGIRYLITFGDPTVIQPWIGVKDYLSLFTVLTLVLGATFQLPVIMVGLARSGVITPDGFRKKRRWTVLIIFIVAAIVTPPDPVTQCLLAAPLVGLYELGIFVAWLGLGEGRPPMDWSVIRPRLIKLGLVAVAVAVLWGPLFRTWQAQRAQERLLDAPASDRPDYRAVFENQLGVAVHHVYRASEDGPEAWLVSETDQGVFVWSVRNRLQKSVTMEERAEVANGLRWTVGYFPSGMATFEIELPRTIPFERFLPQLLDDFELADETLRGPLRSILRSMTGVAKDEADDDRAAEAFRAWGEAHPTKEWQQKPPEKRS